MRIGRQAASASAVLAMVLGATPAAADEDRDYTIYLDWVEAPAASMLRGDVTLDVTDLRAQAGIGDYDDTHVKVIPFVGVFPTGRSVGRWRSGVAATDLFAGVVSGVAKAHGVRVVPAPPRPTSGRIAVQILDLTCPDEHRDPCTAAMDVAFFAPGEAQPVRAKRYSVARIWPEREPEAWLGLLRSLERDLHGVFQDAALGAVLGPVDGPRFPAVTVPIPGVGTRVVPSTRPFLIASDRRLRLLTENPYNGLRAMDATAPWTLLPDEEVLRRLGMEAVWEEHRGIQERIVLGRRVGGGVIAAGMGTIVAGILSSVLLAGADNPGDEARVPPPTLALIPVGAITITIGAAASEVSKRTARQERGVGALDRVDGDTLWKAIEAHNAELAAD